MSDLSSLIESAGADDEMKARIAALMNKMIEQAEDILEYGSPRDRVRLLAANLPALTRAMQGDEAEEAQKRREAAREVIATFRVALIPSLAESDE